MKAWTRAPGAWVAAIALLAGAGTADAEPAESLGLNLDLGFASAYNWRGINAFGDEQDDQNAYLAPAITWQVMPGLSLGYWGAYQVVGDNASAKVDGGVGAESDLFVTYGLEVADATTVSFGVVAYVYPLADEAAAGVANPTYFEPSAAVAWAGPVDVGLKASYFAGLQDQLEAYRYLYVAPTVGKTLALTERVGLGMSLGLGYKAFADDYEEASNGNLLDVSLAIAAPIAVTEQVYVKPAVNAAWTDLDRTASGDDAGFGDEAFVFGSVNVGVNL